MMAKILIDIMHMCTPAHLQVSQDEIVYTKCFYARLEIQLAERFQWAYA
jgi:hypothetical protein